MQPEDINRVLHLTEDPWTARHRRVMRVVYWTLAAAAVLVVAGMVAGALR